MRTAVFLLVLLVASRARAQHASPHIVGSSIVLDRQPAFATDSGALAPDGEVVLGELAALLVAHPEVERVRAVYVMDDRGTPQRNEELAYMRVGTVAAFLEARGVARERVAADVQRGCVDVQGTAHCAARMLQLRIVTLTPQERAALARRQEVHVLFHHLDDAGLNCGGMREFFVDGRMGIVFPTACFVARGGTTVRRDAAQTVQRVARALAGAPARRYAVGVRAPDRTPHAWAATSAQAAALVEALVAAGLSRDRVSAVGYGDRAEEETYDGPATLAPGEALVEIGLLPDEAELPRQ